MDQKAWVVRADEGELIDVAGVAHLFKLTSAETSGRLGVERFTLAPGVVGAQPHIHHAHDECFVALDGVLTVTTGAGDVELAPGDLAFAGRGAVHGFRDAGAVDVVALCLYTPPGYENYFRDVHELVASGLEPTPERLAELRSRYSTTTLS